MVSDKYQCFTNVRPILSSSITLLLDHKSMESKNRLREKGLSLVNAMAVAYVMRDVQMFWRTTRCISATADARVAKDEMDANLSALLPDSVIGKSIQSGLGGTL